MNTWKIIGLAGALLLLILTIYSAVTAPAAPARPVADSCPKYLTVQSVEARYRGAWAGTVTTVRMTDGSVYDKSDTGYYVGQKICVDKL